MRDVHLHPAIRNIVEESTSVVRSSNVKLERVLLMVLLPSAPRLVPDVVLRYTSPEGPHPFVIKLCSRGDDQIPLYVFIPYQSKKPDPSGRPPKLPVLIDFHGGGFVLGSCQEQAPWCAKMARELNAIVISVDYRMGPAWQFPAAIEDGEDVAKAVLDPHSPGYAELSDAITILLVKNDQPAVGIDSTRVAFSGFSSGANLALNLVLSIEKSEYSGTPWPSIISPAHPTDIPLLLFYPSLDCRQLPSERPLAPGMTKKKTFLEGLRLESELHPTYLPRNQTSHPRASPGLARLKDGGLHARARMMLVLPELDTLGAQSAVWIEKVADEGMSQYLSVHKIPGVMHGWTQVPDSWLDMESRRLKIAIFEEAREFVKRTWKLEDKADSKGNA